MANCSLAIVNGLDERPSFDPITGCIVRYRNGGVNVSQTAFSTGFAFRVVKDVVKYNEIDRMSDTKSFSCFDVGDLEEKFDKEKYFNKLHELYRSVFGSEIF